MEFGPGDRVFRKDHELTGIPPGTVDFVVHRVRYEDGCAVEAVPVEVRVFHDSLEDWPAGGPPQPRYLAHPPDALTKDPTP
jgi:hypothetical protein